MNESLKDDAEEERRKREIISQFVSNSTDLLNPEAKFSGSCNGIPFHLSNDFRVLQRCLCILITQREQCGRDIAEISKLRNLVEEDPQKFYNQLRSNDLSFPERQRILAVPNPNQVDSSKSNEIHDTPVAIAHYKDINQNFLFPELSVKPLPPTPSRQGSRTMNSPSHSSNLLSTGTDKSNSSTVSASLTTSSLSSIRHSTPTMAISLDDNGSMRIDDFQEGEAEDTAEPTKKHKQYWTPEEHAKLVELLEVYPDEPMQIKRWEKISKALGNRTPKQVSSRCQKYFIKLAKAGLEIPGRVPNLSQYQTKVKTKRRGARNTAVSSSASASAPAVFMSDDDDDESLLPEIDSTLKDTPEYKELLKLLKLKKRKQREQSVKLQHIGYKCDMCEMDPISGSRFSCVECENTENPVDMCSTCVKIPWTNEFHDAKHTMKKFARPESIADDEYTSLGASIYTDPHFHG